MGSHGRADPLLGRYRSRMTCSACGTDNEAGRKFCAECGSPLALTCAACGASNGPGAKFCGDCGASLVPAAAPIPAPAAERRLVTVLFADLVGFTTMSEARDAEDVRELLSRYFELCRTLIARYGGTVEKFIGDAVMAVWGAPVAKEDDAERAVRAALDLAAAVEALGHEVGSRRTSGRGSACSRARLRSPIGAVGEGMVAGDLVNTASRIQVARRARRASSSARRPSGPPRRRSSTRTRARASSRARPSRCSCGARSGDRRHRRCPALDRPRVAVRRARPGAAGDQGALPRVGRRVEGPSRVGDGGRRHGQVAPVVGVLQVHRRAGGRRPLAPRPLPPVRRGRHLLGARRDGADAGIDRRGRGPRGPGGQAACRGRGVDGRSRRAPVRRAAARTPARPRHEPPRPTARTSSARGGSSTSGSPTRCRRCMVFEDMEWADAALLDFIEYLVDWSKNHPLFVLVLARPDLAERRPTWGAGKRAFTLALPRAALEQRHGAAARRARARAARRAARVASASARRGCRCTPSRPCGCCSTGACSSSAGARTSRRARSSSLDVPETLHALIAARLDGLSAERAAAGPGRRGARKDVCARGACQAQRRRSG